VAAVLVRHYFNTRHDSNKRLDPARRRLGDDSLAT
jgi:uncharacterized membrane protein